MNETEAMGLIQAERRRQVEVEGWSPEHDDAHDDGELARAGNIYRLHAEGRCMPRADGAPMGWPWDRAWWKPKDPTRDLVRAGALYLAEQERLRRLPGSYGLKHSRASRMDRKIKSTVLALCKLSSHERQP
jgi:hypothetical protein